MVVIILLILYTRENYDGQKDTNKWIYCVQSNKFPLF